MAVRDSSTPPLGAVRDRRAELADATHELERALTAPAPTGEEQWRNEVRGTIEGLKRAFRDHLTLTEGDDGFLEQVLADAPRLTHRVASLHEQHTSLSDAIASFYETVLDTSVPEIRKRGLALVSSLLRHRHEGADLVYEAYQVDIGGSAD